MNLQYFPMDRQLCYIEIESCEYSTAKTDAQSIAFDSPENGRIGFSPSFSENPLLHFLSSRLHNERHSLQMERRLELCSDLLGRLSATVQGVGAQTENH